MKPLLAFFFLTSFFLLGGILSSRAPAPRIPFSPRKYVCYRAPQPPPLDGTLRGEAWEKAEWTDDFVDIEGNLKPKPWFRTRAKMLWDDRYLYIGAELEEPHVWATLKERDSVIYMDNDFEAFIDPDGDTHQYYELEINALGTEWDLFLVKPYRDGGPAINGWDILGLRTAVNIKGTLNQPSDVDESWTVEIAIPWKAIIECAPGQKPPAPGDQWRMNFSRVEYNIDVKDKAYVKREDPAKGKPLPEENWVWSPQGLVNMHYPEMWGYVQFSGRTAGEEKEAFVERGEERVKWALRQAYYKQWEFHARSGAFARDAAVLGLEAGRVSGFDFPPKIETTESLFEAVSEGPGRVQWHIAQDGRVWKTSEKK